jgi:hypothetical protein
VGVPGGGGCGKGCKGGQDGQDGEGSALHLVPVSAIKRKKPTEKVQNGGEAMS